VVLERRGKGLEVDTYLQKTTALDLTVVAVAVRGALDHLLPLALAHRHQ
jgi:hypothetical protein